MGEAKRRNAAQFRTPKKGRYEGLDRAEKRLTEKLRLIGRIENRFRERILADQVPKSKKPTRAEIEAYHDQIGGR